VVDAWQLESWEAYRDVVRLGRKTRLTEPRPQTTLSVQTQSAPACPKCGATMVTRTARQGANAGNTFWGCPKYPACKGVRQIERQDSTGPTGLDTPRSSRPVDTHRDQVIG